MISSKLLCAPLCDFVVKIILVLFVITSCSRQNVSYDGIVIAVSIPPQAWFVSQIAGDKASPLILVPPGQNPHSYEPTPRQIQALTSAGVWILSGSEFEIALKPKISSLFHNLVIVDGTQGVQFRQLESHDCNDESCKHHEYTQHDHNSCGECIDPSSLLPSPFSLNIDTHTWLGREPAKILAAHIKDTLCLIDSENEEYYFDRYKNLISEIDEVFDELVILLTPLKGRNVFVYHPSFGYFLDEFGINQQAVETGGKEPGPRELNNLIAKIKEDNAAAVFVQAQFPTSAVRSLAAATGVELISLDPLALDWLENIRFMGQALYNLTEKYE